MTPPITDMRLLGQLFRHPEGDYTKEVGDFIFASNSAMINCTIDCLTLQPHQKVLEIGFGNGKHLPYLFNKESSLQYIGVETSAAMITEATEYNNVLVSQKKVHFLEVAADKLPNFDHSFDVCFSVNTLYFLENPLYYYKKTHALLNSQGKVAIGFIDKSTGKKAPFAREGFQFYTAEEVAEILKAAGFEHITKLPFEETLVSAKGKNIQRKYWVIIGYRC
jgi:putative SAM-dependent methyltransferase